MSAATPMRNGLHPLPPRHPSSQHPRAPPAAGQRPPAMAEAAALDPGANLACYHQQQATSAQPTSPAAAPAQLLLHTTTSKRPPATPMTRTHPSGKTPSHPSRAGSGPLPDPHPLRSGLVGRYCQDALTRAKRQPTPCGGGASRRGSPGSSTTPPREWPGTGVPRIVPSWEILISGALMEG